MTTKYKSTSNDEPTYSENDETIDVDLTAEEALEAQVFAECVSELSYGDESYDTL